MKNLTISAVQCPHCKDIIFSRARHDFRSCSCQKICIDGGRDYLKLGWSDGPNPPEIIRIELFEITEKDLVDDWNYRKDRYGCVKPSWTWIKEKIDTQKYKYLLNKLGKIVETPKIKGRRHKCERSKVCSCSMSAMEPDENCEVHGLGEYPSRCGTCGRFIKYDKNRNNR